MHFTCLVTWHPHEVMANRVQPSDAYYNEKTDRYELDWIALDESQWICDWYEIWWRRDYYISVEDTSEPELYQPLFSKWYGDEFEKVDRSKLHCRASARKWNIEWFRDGKNSRCKKYPDTFSYIDMDWVYHKVPETFDFCDDRKKYDWTEKTYNKEAYEKAKKKWRRDYLKWYKSIPDDEILTIIDYHD